MMVGRQGIAASAGIAVATAWVMGERKADVPKRSDVVTEEEIGRFREAIDLSLSELQTLHEQTKVSLGEEQAKIIESHIGLLGDSAWQKSVISKIDHEHVNAEYALSEANSIWIAKFENMKNEYMRERAADLRDIGSRVLRHLTGGENDLLPGPSAAKQTYVIIARDLTPSQTVQLDPAAVAGFATETGGKTSHTAILARAMGIPAVVGLTDITGDIHSGETVIIDGDAGHIIWKPTPMQLSYYNERQKAQSEHKARRNALVHVPTQTMEGHRVELTANIGRHGEAQQALHGGAEGIGLFRSEFLYMDRAELPDEEEQLDAYRIVAETMAERHVIIRTLDIGGDKDLPYLGLEREMNPFLGYRAIRISLDRKALFRTQIRAILRASAFGRVAIMFPMIATLTEFREAKAVVLDMMKELKAENIAFDEEIPIGMMVEVPASALIADVFALEADFLSIGTNDLIQYTMACDRMNERVSYLYQPYHPAVLRLIRHVIDSAHRHGKRVGMCGELSADLTAVPVLLGLGLDEFSMSIPSILPVRQLISTLDLPSVKQLAEDVLQLSTQEEVEVHIRRFLSD